MTLVAACFSLRLFRMGGVQRMVLGGVTAGFVLYVVTKIIGDLGNAGFVSAPVAAWSPGRRGLSVRRVRVAPPGGRLMGRAIARRIRACPPWRGLAARARAGVRPRFSCGVARWPQRRRRRAAERDPGKLYVDADKLIYDKDHDVVTADGGVVLYYKNRVLQGDHVVYDRKAQARVRRGHVKLTDEHGNVTYSPRARADRGFRQRLRRRGAGDHRRQDPLDLAAHRALERFRHRVAKRRLHRLRALQGASRMAAAMAGARRRDHREPGHPHDLFPRRLFRRLRRAGRLHAVFFRPPTRP